MLPIDLPDVHLIQGPQMACNDTRAVPPKGSSGLPGSEGPTSRLP